MKGCGFQEKTDLCYRRYRDLALSGIAFPVSVGKRFQIVGARECAVSSTGEPGNSSLVEERSWVWVEIQEKVRVAAQI
jgi:hypothetical protein